jgi:dipeptidyl aminopeptidase/acylaminoacyl peptidase
MDNMALATKVCSAAIARLFVASLLIAGPSLAASPSNAVPVELFGVLPTLEDVLVSPNGQRLAFVRTSGEERIVAVHEVAGGSLGAVKVGNIKLRALQWINDDLLLITVSNTGPPPAGFVGSVREWFRSIVLDLTAHKVRPLDFAVDHERVFNVLSGEPVIRNVQDKTVLYAPGLFVDHKAYPGLFSFNAPEMRARLIDKSYAYQTNWLVNESGQIAAQLTYNDEKKIWTISARRNDRVTPITSGTAAIDIPMLIGFSNDGSAVLTQFIKNGSAIWVPLNVRDGTWGKPLNGGEHFSKPVTERLSGRILGGAHDLEEEHYVFFDNETQAHWNAVLRAIPDEKLELASHSDDFSKIVVRVFGAKHGYVYAFFDWYTHAVTILGQVYEGISKPAEVRLIEYRAADGLAIPGFLTLPRGVDAKDLPLIVLPHGGPAAADTKHFDWWAQALAAQGYAVLQPNYRGSTVSNRMLEAGFGEWGRKMQTDLSDGVRFLAAQGVVDPKRVCIVGDSYGGYAALAGVTLDPGVYRCAVSVSGIADLRRFRRWIEENKASREERYWDRFIGIADKNDPAIAAVSPIEHINAVNVPVLLIHGRDDTVVPYEQSDVMLSALKRAGKTAELVTLKHEDHWLSTGATRLQMLQATVNFLKTNNPVN